MDKLSSELQDKILFPKYYKTDKNLQLNEKFYISNCLNNISYVNNQIKSLVKELNYQKNRSDYNRWKNTKYPSYTYILYKSLEKKKKSTRQLFIKTTCKFKINYISNYCINNNIINLNNNTINIY